MRVVLKHVLFASALILAATVLQAQDTQVYTSKDEGVMLPVPVTQVRPQYTAAAMDRRIEGTVLLECVVATDGRVGDVKVTESLDSMYGLDMQAVEALRQWTFKPGTKDGKAVAVRLQINMKFTLQ